MNHQPYMRIVKDADCAVLFIHGILGSPDHFDFLLPLVPNHISVQNLLLPGHGRGVRDFSASSMRKWESTVKNAIATLSKSHNRIYIVAHSMGTLLAIQEAINSPCIKGLFLLAIPVSPFPRKRMFTNAKTVFTGMIEDSDIHGKAADAAYSIAADKHPLRYLPWIVKYLELFKKIHEIRNILPQLTTPTVAYQSYNDEMVSNHSIQYLRQNSNITVYELKNSWHNLYGDSDQEMILQGFQHFINEIEAT